MSKNFLLVILLMVVLFREFGRCICT